jgi:hypothetical protein
MTEFTNPLNFLDPMYLMGLIAERQDFGDERPKYIGQRFFPVQNVPEQIVAWESIRRENRLAGIYSSRGKAMPGDDIGFKTHFANLLWIRAAKTIDSDMVQKLRDPGTINIYKAGGPIPYMVEGAMNRVIAKMNKYLAFIDDQIASMKEYFAIKAMMGILQWPPLGADGMPIALPMPEWNAGQAMTMRWPFTDAFQYHRDRVESDGVTPAPRTVADLTGVNGDVGAGFLWSDPSANPLVDMEVLGSLMEDTKGVNPDNATLLMSRLVLSRIVRLPVMQNWLLGRTFSTVGGWEAAASLPILKEKVKDSFGFKIELYDAKWTYIDFANPLADGSENIKSVRFLPVGRVIVVPQGEKIGTMAQAPHENQTGDFVSGDVVHVHREEKEPHDREMTISNVCWPLLQQPEGLAVLDVM